MSISYNRLGSNGRLGNQMFQYAGLRGIAKQNGYSWLIPPPDDYGDSNYGLFDCFEMSTVTFQNFGFTENVQNLATGCFHFNEKFFRECPDNINLHDYFQTEKYFKNAESIIRQDYTFLPEILDPCKEVVEQFDKPIFIHVRRGDYVKQPENHPVCPLSYYENSLKEFPEDTPVFVFSDDLDWCKEHFTDDRFVLPTENIKYSHTADTNDGRIESFVPYYDLCMMSLCHGAIIANSSMSWWGAWLQNNRGKIVAPKPWFGTRYNDYDMSDLLPESWIEKEV
jgi:hypothetical protein|tara:strand:+ start:7237 stop:8079 length:843 start_codon:yes stop_codon:yes gene_type:complete